jgi:hypothetical protein
MALGTFLESNGFRRVPLTRTGVGHFEVEGTLNGHTVRVLIDTGAASTVASLSRVSEIGFPIKPISRCGAGAGGTNLEVFQVDCAELRLGDVVPKVSALLAMDLTHVNTALAQKGVIPVDVILGVDVFDAHEAVIDYGSQSLFLREAQGRETQGREDREGMLNAKQKLGLGAMLATVGGLGIVLMPALGLSQVGSPWDFILGFLFGVSAGAGTALVVSGLIEHRSKSLHSATHEEL